jgi:uncharacterized membrane protein YdjX (TVP38/TMEM64 family)
LRPSRTRVGVGSVLAVAAATAAVLVALNLLGRLVDTHAAGTDAREIVSSTALRAALLLGIGVIAGCALFPMSVFAVICALALGTPLGVLVTVVVASTSAAVEQRIGHTIIRRRGLGLVAELVRRVRPLITEHGLTSVITVRLTPLLPFALSNYALGAFELRSRTVWLGTAISVVPRTWLIVGVTNDVIGSSSPLSVPGLVYGLALRAGAAPCVASRPSFIAVDPQKAPVGLVDAAPMNGRETRWRRPRRSRARFGRGVSQRRRHHLRAGNNVVEFTNDARVRRRRRGYRTRRRHCDRS